VSEHAFGLPLLDSGRITLLQARDTDRLECLRRNPNARWWRIG
jgi:hypothetical protein